MVQQLINKEEALHALIITTFIVALTLSFQCTVYAQMNGAPAAYRLLGTIEGKAFTGAVLSDSTGVQTFYRLNEKLPDGSQLVSVRSDSVTLRGTDRTTYDIYIANDTKFVASAHRDVPADPYPTGTTRAVDPEAAKALARRHGRRSQTPPAEN